MTNRDKKKIDAELYQYAEHNLQHADTEHRPEPNFSDRYKKRKAAVSRRFQRPRRGSVAVAAALSLLLIACTSITAYGLWGDIWTFTIETKDSFLALFSNAPAETQPQDITDTILLKNVPSRFQLEFVDGLSGLVFYEYTAENGDKITVSEEKRILETNLDSDSVYEVRQIEGRDVFISYKNQKSEYSVYFQYNSNTAVTIIGNLTEEEALQIVTSTLQHGKEENQ